MNDILLLLFPILLFACQSESPKESQTEASTENAPEEQSATPSTFIVNIDNFRLRDQPGLEGKEIAKLRKGTALTDLGQVSDFTTRIKLRGIQFNEPWLKVQTVEGLEGWVYGGGLNFSLNKNGGTSKLLLDKRLQTLFGKGVADGINNYRANFEKADSDEAILSVYREGIRLRDTLGILLETSIPVENYEALPDLFWLDEALPAYVPQLVAEGTLYYLFNDYKEWQKKVQTTEGSADDAFIELCLHIHSMDSVEHFFPGWMIQTWDYGGHSLLGQGIHHQLMTEMDQLYQQQSPFTKEVMDFKHQLLMDIYGEGTSYWETRPKIVAELQAIIDGGYSILKKEDIIALKMRLKLLEDPKANDLEVNHRSGMVE